MSSPLVIGIAGRAVRDGTLAGVHRAVDRIVLAGKARDRLPPIVVVD